jgi:hypothetical protein
MAYGKYVHLYSGDTVESIDSSIYEFGGGYTVDGVNFISIANRISLLTITDEGDYFFRYRKLDSTPFSDSDLDTQVLIITNNRPYFVKEVDEKFDELDQADADTDARLDALEAHDTTNCVTAVDVEPEG